MAYWCGEFASPSCCFDPWEQVLCWLSTKGSSELDLFVVLDRNHESAPKLHFLCHTMQPMLGPAGVNIPASTAMQLGFWVSRNAPLYHNCMLFARKLHSTLFPLADAPNTDALHVIEPQVLPPVLLLGSPKTFSFSFHQTLFLQKISQFC